MNMTVGATEQKKLNLVSQNQAKNIPVVLPSFPIEIWGKSVEWFMNYERISKQTNRDYKFIDKDNI